MTSPLKKTAKQLESQQDDTDTTPLLLLTTDQLPLPDHPPHHPPPPHHRPHKPLIIAIVLCILFLILKHICPHFRNGHPQSDHIYVSPNGTISDPPASGIHLHFDEAVDADGISLWFHKYVRDAKPGDGHGGHDDNDDKEEEGKQMLGHNVHHRDSHHHHHRRERQHYNRHEVKRDDEDCHDNAKESNDENDGDDDNDNDGHHKRWFTRCEPEHVSHGVATFGKSCFDVAADYEEAEKGQTITYALIGVAKRRSEDGEGDDEEEEEDIEDLDLEGKEDSEGVVGVTMHKGRRYYVITNVRIHKHL
ncbi:UNVERIFIED_CONTAM: hypothetical protein HDU68_011159 [Siphonaria sp. JEL0065]|nr:hypothetical protein HDU68_011159 [Siphonaria sp. JEL0065]